MMNEKWLTRFKQWDVFSKFVLNIEVLQIIMVVTFIVSLIVLIIGSIFYAVTIHNSGGQITWLLTTGQFFFKIFLLEVIAVVILFLMKIPMGIVTIIGYASGEWNDVKNQYKHVFKKDKD